MQEAQEQAAHLLQQQREYQQVQQQLLGDLRLVLSTPLSTHSVILASLSCIVTCELNGPARIHSLKQSRHTHLCNDRLPAHTYALPMCMFVS